MNDSTSTNDEKPKEDKEQELVDPLQRLPFETFEHLVSFLPPFSIAQSSAVSNQWRTIINSDPTLWTEIDLSRLKARRFSNNDVLFHLERLSRLSLNNLVKVTLNMTSYCKQMLFLFDKAPGKLTRRENRILETLKPKNPLSVLVESQSHLKIKELSIILDPGKEIDYANTILGTLIDQVEPFPSLQKLMNIAPTMVSMASGVRFSLESPNPITFTDIPDSRWLEIRDNVHTDEDEEESDDEDEEEEEDFRFVPLLQKVTKWTGKGLAAIRFKENARWSIDDQLEDLMMELRKSSSTLQTMDVTAWDQNTRNHFFNLALTSPELIQFTHTYHGEEGKFPVETFEKVYREIVWGAGPKIVNESFGRWQTILRVNAFGLRPGNQDFWQQVAANLKNHSIQQFSLGPTNHNGEQLSFGLIGSGVFSLIIHGCSESIKLLEICGVQAGYGGKNQSQSDDMDSSLIGKSLPNLEILTIGNVEEEVYDYFSGFQLPKISILEIGCNSNNNQIHFDGLMKMVKRHGLKLKRLAVGSGPTFRVNEISRPPEPTPEIVKSLVNLEVLLIGDRWGEECGLYLSKLEFPRLTRLNGVDPALAETFFRCRMRDQPTSAVVTDGPVSWTSAYTYSQ